MKFCCEWNFQNIYKRMKDASVVSRCMEGQKSKKSRGSELIKLYLAVRRRVRHDTQYPARVVQSTTRTYTYITKLY